MLEACGNVQLKSGGREVVPCDRFLALFYSCSYRVLDILHVDVVSRNRNSIFSTLIIETLLLVSRWIQRMMYPSVVSSTVFLDCVINNFVLLRRKWRLVRKTKFFTFLVWHDRSRDENVHEVFNRREREKKRRNVSLLNLGS